MAGQDTSTVAPSLLRAVAEATQPFGPFLQGSSLHALEVLLHWHQSACKNHPICCEAYQACFSSKKGSSCIKISSLIVCAPRSEGHSVIQLQRIAAFQAFCPQACLCDRNI